MRGSATGTIVEWKAERRLPMMSARPEFRVGDRVIGYPDVVNGRTLRLQGAEVSNIDDLQAWLGARRLDGPTPPLRTTPDRRAQPAQARNVRINPAKPGPHETTSFDYRYGTLPWRRYASDMEVLGQAVVPKGVDDAPLVLFLHGRHEACYGNGDNGTWPCAGASKPVPSFRGYTYLQRRLATQGYATVSISANAINQQDYRDADGGAMARSKLVRHHLKLLARKAAQTGGRWSGRLDMDRVVLVGHSRGGDGVNQAVVDSGRAAPYSIVGQLLLAPTDFAQHTAGYTPTVVALPYCDGDVYDLQGQRFVDASAGLARGDKAIRSSVLVRGANHNYFNTEWTPRISQAPSFDDWYDPSDAVCGQKVSETRLGAHQQRKVGRVLATAAVRMFVYRDPDMLKLFDAVGGVTTDAMGDNALVWSHAIGGARQPIRLGHGGDTTVRGDAENCLATAVSRRHEGLRPCHARLRPAGRGVHWLQRLDRFVSRGTLHEARLDWRSKGRVGGFDFDRPVDLSAPDATFDMRLIGTPGARRIRVRLSDDAGQTWSRRVRILPLMAGGELHPYWAQSVRIDAHEAPATFDATAVVAVELVSTSSSGTAWIVDAAVRTPEIPAVSDRVLPRLRIGAAQQREGDRGKGTVRIPYRVSGPMAQPARFDVALGRGEGNRRTRMVRVNLPVGQRSGSVSFRYRRNTRDDLKRVFVADAQAVRGLALNDYHGRAVVVDDDPAPKMTFEPKRATYRAGEKIRIRVRMSKPAGFQYWAFATLRDVNGFAPIRNADVPRKWLRRHGGLASQPKRKLSKTVYGLDVWFPPGKRVATLTIPTVRRTHVRTKRFRLVWRAPHGRKYVTVTTVKPANR